MRIKKGTLTANSFLAGMATAYLPARSAGRSIFQVVQTPTNKSNGLTGKDNGLFAVCASSPSDTWAVGHAVIHFETPPGPIFRLVNGPTNQPVIEHWDGTQWSVFPSPSTSRET